MVYFHTATQKTETKALVDSGATENFVSPTLLDKLGVKPRKLLQPIDISTVDGSEHKDGQLTEYCWLKVNLGKRTTLMVFLVAALGSDHLILGYPFLYTFNPRIDWRKGIFEEGKVQLTSTHQQNRKGSGHEILKMQREAI